MTRLKIPWFWKMFPVIALILYLGVKYRKEHCQQLPIRFFQRRNNETMKDYEIRQLKGTFENLKKSLHKMYPLHANILAKNNLYDLPWIYVITPTYTRTVQKAELTRLGNTLLHVPNLHWILIEDSSNKTALVSNYLARSGLSYTHLNIASPSGYRTKYNIPKKSKPRGVLQRNKGLEWIRNNLNPIINKGVVYFADDDNTYSLKLFEEMRFTNKVSVWPVGFAGNLRFEAPIVRNNSVMWWLTSLKRPFSVDMAGFAMNINLLFQNPEVIFSLGQRQGHLESNFLQSVVTLADLEPKADNCTKILVWHTRTEAVSLSHEKNLGKHGRRWYFSIEV